MKTKLISKIYKIALVGVLLFGQSACSDFLTEKAPSNLTPDNFYTIPDHAEAAIAKNRVDQKDYIKQVGKVFSQLKKVLTHLKHLTTT